MGSRWLILRNTLLNLLTRRINIWAQHRFSVVRNPRCLNVDSVRYGSELKRDTPFSFCELALSIELAVEVLRVSLFSCSQQSTFYKSTFNLSCKSSRPQKGYERAESLANGMIDADVKHSSVTGLNVNFQTGGCLQIETGSTMSMDMSVMLL